MLNSIVLSKNLVVTIISLLLLVACKPVVVTDQDIPCDLPSLNSQSSQSDPLKIAIQVDGSGSMLGYVNNNPNSRYIQTLDLLENIFTIGKKSREENSELEYYRSGEGNQKIGRWEYRKARRGEFYTGDNPKFKNVTSQLHQAITPPEETDKLIVLVTDLYQNNADVTLINQMIENNYLKKEDYAVGILAIRSEFQGTVYASDTKVAKDFPYNISGSNNLDELRPFYVVFLGPYSDMTYYFDKLKRTGGELINSSKLVIFYPGNPVSEIAFLQGKPQLSEGINRPFSLNNGQVAVEVSSPPYELLEIDLKETEEKNINYSIPLSFFSNTLIVNSDYIKTNITVQSFDTFEEKFKEEAEKSSLKNVIELSDWKINNNRLDFTTKIRPDQFPEPGIYIFQVDAMAMELKEPSWWQEWDWESRKSIKDGSKTYNLSTFLQNLKNTTTDLMKDGENKPIIGRFCYVIQKN